MSLTELLLVAMASALLLALVALLRSIRRERRMRWLAEAALGRATVPQLNEVTSDNAFTSGQVETVTILAIDIRDFTAMSEGKTRDEMGAFLNAFFSVLIPIVESHGGWVSAFLGDGLMAVFRTGDERARPILASVALIRAVRHNWGIWRGRGYGDELRVGIGIHQGVAFVGFIGSKTRFTFTAVGESANVAARLESATKGIDCRILVSESAFEGMSEKERVLLVADRGVEIKPLAPIQLRGHRTAFEVVALNIQDVPPGSEAHLII